MSSDWKNIWQKIREWDGQGRKLALATVVKTWGSSPRPVGSHLLIDQDGHMEGSVSGGCIDGVVVSSALDAIKTGKGELLKFEVSTDRAWEVGLSCGGEVQVLVDPLTNIAKKAHYILDVDVTSTKTYDSDTEITDGKKYTHIYKAPLKLIIVGAVHITKALIAMAEALDIEVVLIDPRTAYANKHRFPSVEINTNWPDEALNDIEITSGTAIVTLSHDPKLDDPAIEIAIKSKAFYVAALGSRKTQKSRIERLRKKGFSEAEIARIHGPAGLDIGSLEPAEIALSIVAELISVHRKGEK